MHEIESKRTSSRIWVGAVLSAILNLFFIVILVFLTGKSANPAPDVRLIDAPLTEFFEEPKRTPPRKPRPLLARRKKPARVADHTRKWQWAAPPIPEPRTSSYKPERQIKAGLRIPPISVAGDIEIPVSSLAPAEVKITFEMADVDTPPRRIGGLSPAYPPEARQHRIEGCVSVRFLVEPDGSVSRISIIKSEPPVVFDNAVISVLKNWRFEPGKVRGRKVRTWCVQEISFSLED